MSRSAYISQILLEGENLHIGDSMRLNCPWCREHTFSITRTEMGVLYNCYRASCPDAKGFIGIDKIAGDRIKPKAKRRTVRFYSGAIDPLDPEAKQFLCRRFAITETDIARHGIRYAPERERFVLPILTPLGYTRGHDLHSWDKHVDRKSIVYPHMPDGAMSSWHPDSSLFRHPGIVVVVEDIMSAIRVSRLENHVGLALLGSSLGPDKLKELMDYNPMQVIIALDADATDKAYDMAWDNKLLFRRIRVAKLERDLKDLRDDTEVEEALYGQSI